MDVHRLQGDTLLVAKMIHPPKVPVLFVGPWIRAHGKRPSEVARGTGINEGYLSSIISGKKKNPSTEKLALIADFLKMPLGDLYKAPPPQAVLDQVAKYDPAVILRLSQNRRKSG